MKGIKFFVGMEKERVVRILSEFESMGKLRSFIKKVAPDYIRGGEVDSFLLMKDLKLENIKKELIVKQASKTTRRIVRK